ncbi:hypothetical protein KSP40_PGU008930 [Platanthera guangdongensis]|uniref:Uncharacterized protein n=1 Tax=Platanthera guangdongensis TaxID=2320717 RepID=A0ABR2M0L3_9ASPA
MITLGKRQTSTMVKPLLIPKWHNCSNHTGPPGAVRQISLALNMDKSWIDLQNRASSEYILGVDKFLEKTTCLQQEVRAHLELVSCPLTPTTTTSRSRVNPLIPSSTGQVTYVNDRFTADLRPANYLKKFYSMYKNMSSTVNTLQHGSSAANSDKEVPFTGSPISCNNHAEKKHTHITGDENSVDRKLCSPTDSFRDSDSGACEEDMEEALLAAKMGVRTFTSGWLMNYVMTQELDLDAHQFAESL